MKVQELMTNNVKSCSPDYNLAAAATLMWESDIGVLPVVNAQGKVNGMLTDRDIAIAVGSQGRLAADIRVGEIISGKVFSVHLNDDIHTALKTMRAEKIHRLPVVNDSGMLQGILSMNDIVLRAEEARGRREPELSYDETMNTLKAICEHRSLHQAAHA